MSNDLHRQVIELPVTRKNAPQFLRDAKFAVGRLLEALVMTDQHAHNLANTPSEMKPDARPAPIETALTELDDWLKKAREAVFRPGRTVVMTTGGREPIAKWEELSPADLLRQVGEPPGQYPVEAAESTSVAILVSAQRILGIAGWPYGDPVKNLTDPAMRSDPLKGALPNFADPDVRNQFRSALGREFRRAEQRLNAELQAPPPKPKTGRRGSKPTTREQDIRIWDAWHSGQHIDYAGLAVALGMKKEEVQKAMDRERDKRKPKKSKKPNRVEGGETAVKEN